MEKTKYLLLSTTLLGLAACGGDDVIEGPTLGQPIAPLPPGEEAARVFSNDAGDVGQSLSDGMTLTARQVALAGINLNYGTGDTGLSEADVFTVRLNDDGEMTLVLKGREIAFVAADRDPDDDGTVYGYNNQDACDTSGVCESLFSYSGEIDELKSTGTGWYKVLRAQSNQINSDGSDLAAFAVIGTETEDADLAGLASATYFGRARADLVPATGFESNSQSRTRVRTDLTMTADFGAGTISGVLDNMTVQAPGSSDRIAIDGTVAMTEAEFSINGFKGGFEGDADFDANTEIELGEGSYYAGAFYGTTAQEVAGTISLTGTLDGAPTNGIGYFSGNQD